MQFACHKETECARRLFRYNKTGSSRVQACLTHLPYLPPSFRIPSRLSILPHLSHTFPNPMGRWVLGAGRARHLPNQSGPLTHSSNQPPFVAAPLPQSLLNSRLNRPRYHSLTSRSSETRGSIVRIASLSLLCACPTRRRCRSLVVENGGRGLKGTLKGTLPSGRASLGARRPAWLGGGTSVVTVSSLRAAGLRTSGRRSLWAFSVRLAASVRHCRRWRRRLALCSKSRATGAAYCAVTIGFLMGMSGTSSGLFTAGLASAHHCRIWRSKRSSSSSGLAKVAPSRGVTASNLIVACGPSSRLPTIPGRPCRTRRRRFARSTSLATVLPSGGATTSFPTVVFGTSGSLRTSSHQGLIGRWKCWGALGTSTPSKGARTSSPVPVPAAPSSSCLASQGGSRSA